MAHELQQQLEGSVVNIVGKTTLRQAACYVKTLPSICWQ